MSRAVLFIDETHIKCKECNEIKELSKFEYHRIKNKIYYRGVCRKCRDWRYNLKVNLNISRMLTHRFRKLKRRAKGKDIHFNISLEDFIDIYIKQNGICFYSGYTMNANLGEGKDPNGVSIDRIIPETGYTKDNIVFCCFRVNRIKNDITLQEMKLWMPLWYSKIEERICMNMK